jgi:hypothetical protein
MGRAILNWLPWHRDVNVLADEEVDSLDVGTVLIEISDKLPAHMYPHWRIEKRFKGPGDMAHVSLRNISDPHAHKLLAVSSLVSARRFQLMHEHAA